MKLLRKVLSWVAEEAWEKVNLKAKWAEIKEMGKEWGPRFIVMAVVWEIIEDGVFPLLSWYFGVPWLIPIFLIWHFEPVAYPVFFWAFKTYDRVKGKTPWEADRPAYSSHWRTALKVLAYRVSSISGLALLTILLDVSPWLVTAYAVLMTVYNFVHERIWHDSNFGIVVETDQVLMRRTILKSLTYRTVSFLLLAGALAVVVSPFPWKLILCYQGAMLSLYYCLETAWSYSTLGISGIPTPAKETSG